MIGQTLVVVVVTIFEEDDEEDTKKNQEWEKEKEQQYKEDVKRRALRDRCSTTCKVQILIPLETKLLHVKSEKTKPCKEKRGYTTVTNSPIQSGIFKGGGTLTRGNDIHVTPGMTVRWRSAPCTRPLYCHAIVAQILVVP